MSNKNKIQTLLTKSFKLFLLHNMRDLNMFYSAQRINTCQFLELLPVHRCPTYLRSSIATFRAMLIFWLIFSIWFIHVFVGSHGQMTKGQRYAHYIITKLKWDAYQRVNKCIYIHTFVLKSSKQATLWSVSTVRAVKISITKWGHIMLIIVTMLNKSGSFFFLSTIVILNYSSLICTYINVLFQFFYQLI